MHGDVVAGPDLPGEAHVAHASQRGSLSGSRRLRGGGERDVHDARQHRRPLEMAIEATMIGTQVKAPDQPRSVARRR